MYTIDNIRENFRNSDHMIRQAAAEGAYHLAEQLLEHDYISLWNMLHHDVYQTVKIAAAETLCLLKRDNQYATARNTILRLLSYPGLNQPHQPGAEFVRAKAVEALIVIRDNNPDILVALAYATKDEFEFVRERARQALMRLSNFQGAYRNQKYYKSTKLLPEIQIYPSSDVARGHSQDYHKNFVAALKIGYGDFADRFERNITKDETSNDGVRTVTLHVNRADFIKGYADRIVAHARRRIDLFFYTLVFFYGKTQQPNETIIAVDPPFTHGKGAVRGTDLATDAAHDALIPSFMICRADGEKNNPLAGTHFQATLNMTTELPADINKFDTHVLEGHYNQVDKMRAQALHIINQTGKGGLTPVDALEIFLTRLHEHFEKKKEDYLSKSDSELRKIIFSCQKEGSFGDLEDLKNLKSSKPVIWKPGHDGGVLLDYIYLLLRINPAHQAQLNSMGNSAIIINSDLFKSYLANMKTEIANGQPVAEPAKQPFSTPALRKTVSAPPNSMSSHKTPMTSVNPTTSATAGSHKSISPQELIKMGIAVLKEHGLIGNDEVKTPSTEERKKRVAAYGLQAAKSPFEAAVVKLYLNKQSQSIENLLTNNIDDLKSAYSMSPAIQRRPAPVPFPQMPSSTK